MTNMQDFIGNSHDFKKFKVDDLLFAEYECPTDIYPTTVWWQNNFFAFVLAGETLLKTPQGEYRLKAGDCAFAKKGTVLMRNHSQEMFSQLLVFVPDDFIRTVIKKYKLPLVTAEEEEVSDTVIPLQSDEVMIAYSLSLLAHFRQEAIPAPALLKIKFEELIVNILTNNNHAALKTYFSELPEYSKPSIREMMETNFFSNLSLQQFSRMCARSLSAFKQEFKNLYHTTPGKWLQDKRLQYARFLLETTDNTVEEICMESGFENRSHFIRVFKNKYGAPPRRLKMQLKLA